MEREFAGWPRSYPAGGFGEEGRDALAYSPAGFIWNDALAHGKTVCDFGEFTTAHKQWKDSGRKGEPDFLDCYHDFLGGSNAIAYSCEPDIEVVAALSRDEHDWLGFGRAGCLARRAIHQRPEAI